jgi:ATP-dependent RNA/DNA helicase IGHMBP2
VKRTAIAPLFLLGAPPQALEVATWGALLRAPRAVLAGDHLQLPPTIISEQAAREVMLLSDLPSSVLDHRCICALLAVRCRQSIGV